MPPSLNSQLVSINPPPSPSHTCPLYRDITHALLRPETAKKEKKTKVETPFVVAQRKKEELAAARAAAIAAAASGGGVKTGGAGGGGRDSAKVGGRVQHSRSSRRALQGERLLFDIGSNSSSSSKSSDVTKFSDSAHSAVARALVKYKQVQFTHAPHRTTRGE